MAYYVSIKKKEVVINEADCGTVNGITVAAITEGDESVVSLKERIVGRVALDSIVDIVTDSQVVAAGDQTGIIRLFNPSTGKEIRQMSPGQGGCQTIAFSPDGQLLASGGWDAKIHFWRVSSGREIRTWGDLGLDGAWKSRPVIPYGSGKDSAPRARFQERVLQGGAYGDRLKDVAGLSLTKLFVGSDAVSFHSSRLASPQRLSRS